MYSMNDNVLNKFLNQSLINKKQYLKLYEQKKILTLITFSENSGCKIQDGDHFVIYCYSAIDNDLTLVPFERIS